MLKSGELQFAYKADTPTTQCAWAAREVVIYYNKMLEMYPCYYQIFNEHVCK